MNPPAPFDRRLDGLAVGLLVLLALAIQLPIFDRWVSLLDEGAIAQIADQINHGLPPYRNGVHLAFPGIFYSTAALFAVFEPSLLVGRYAMVAVFCTLVALAYVLARSVAGRGVAIATGVLIVAYRAWAFPHWHMLSYSPVAILWQVFGLVLLSLHVRRPRTGLLVGAGLAAGIGALFKQDSSAITCAALAFFLLFIYRAGAEGRKGGREVGGQRSPLRDTALYVAAAALPPAAMLLAFLPSGLTFEILYQTVWVPLVAKPLWASASGGGSYTMFPPVWPPWEATDAIRRDGFFNYFPSLLLDLHWRQLISNALYQKTILPETFVRILYLAPLVTLATFIVRGGVAWRLRANRDDDTRWRLSPQLGLLVAYGVGTMLSFNRPRDWAHLMILYVPTLILSAALVEVLAGREPGRRRRLVTSGHALAVGVMLATSFWLVMSARQYYDAPIVAERAGIYGKPHVAAVLNPLLEALQPRDEKNPAPLAALPAYPVLNFLTARPLATRFLTLLPLEEFPDRDQQIVESITRDPRTEFVYSLQRAAVDERPQEYAPGVFEHLVEHWSLGSGPGSVFSGTDNDGLIVARLVARTPIHERVLYDFADQIGEGTLSYVGAGEAGEGRIDAGATEGPTVEIDTWPFESPVLSLSPPQPPVRSRLQYSVSFSEPTRLRFGVAMNPDAWTNFLPFALHFSVRVDDEIVFDRDHDPRGHFDDRRWIWADVPVSAGPHTIAFETGTRSGKGPDSGIAGFARPRLVVDAARIYD